jgi:hypothetical protein
VKLDKMGMRGFFKKKSFAKGFFWGEERRMG